MQVQPDDVPAEPITPEPETKAPPSRRGLWILILAHVVGVGLFVRGCYVEETQGHLARQPCDMLSYPDDVRRVSERIAIRNLAERHLVQVRNAREMTQAFNRVSCEGVAEFADGSTAVITFTVSVSSRVRYPFVEGVMVGGPAP